MTALERVQTYVMDVDNMIRQRDDYFRQVRALSIEAEIISRSAIDKFVQQQQQALEENRLATMQVDECFRVAERFILMVTHLESVEDARERVTALKVALNKVAETTAHVASAKADIDVFTTLDNRDYVAAASKDLELSELELKAYSDYAVALVPADYVP